MISAFFILLITLPNPSSHLYIISSHLLVSLLKNCYWRNLLKIICTFQLYPEWGSSIRSQSKVVPIRPHSGVVPFAPRAGWFQFGLIAEWFHSVPEQEGSIHSQSRVVPFGFRAGGFHSPPEQGGSIRSQILKQIINNLKYLNG